MAAAGDGERNRLLFITANTGSLFEETSNLEAGWVREIVQEVKSWQPAFFALHMQEIGGKNYRKCMSLVKGFIQDLRTTFSQVGYSDGRCYLDEEMEAEDRFTALGSLYFCHRDVTNRVSIFDFRRNVFEPLTGFEVHSLNLNSEPTVERKRFPKSMFSEVKWSRKGFMRSRWRIAEVVFDLVNIHLFHDACNLMAVEQSPSIYSGHRRDALKYALKELDQDEFTTTPMFLFGDFNFRLDTRSLIESLAPMSDQLPIRDGNGIVKLEYRKPRSTECILSIGTKSFVHENHESLHYGNLLQFDKELAMCPQLAEWPITFPPSYPYSEDASAPTMYMKTRAPAWCDRVLMNEAAYKLVQKIRSPLVSYNTIGQKTCMGDHKPVFLTFPLPPSSADVSKPVNGESSEACRSVAPPPLWGPAPFHCDFADVPNSSDIEEWKEFAINLAKVADRETHIFGNREYQVYALRIESLRFNVRSPMQFQDEAVGTGDDFDEFVTIITLHDDQTVTVMDASSYGFSFNESWGGSLDRPRSSARIFEDIDEGDEDLGSDEMQPRFTVIARAVSNGSAHSGSSISRCTSSTFTVTTPTTTEETEELLPELGPGLSKHPPPPPPSPELPKMRLFDSNTDSDLVLRRRSILQRYPYYTDIIAVKDQKGKPEAIYAKPASPRSLSPSDQKPVSEPRIPEKPPIPKRSVVIRNGGGPGKDTPSKTDVVVPRGINKSVQVEFNSTFVRVPTPKLGTKHKKEAPLSTRDKALQTDPSLTGDENTLENELARRRQVGLDRWTFDQRWDILRELLTVERTTSVQVVVETREKTEVIKTVRETPCLVQKRPISVGDRKLAQRKRRIDTGQRRGSGCSCF